MPGDESEATSKPLDVRRGVVQGDIFSPVCFIIALECLMRESDKDGGVTVLGVLLSRLEFADDAALIDESIDIRQGLRANFKHRKGIKKTCGHGGPH